VNYGKLVCIVYHFDVLLSVSPLESGRTIYVRQETKEDLWLIFYVVNDFFQYFC